MIHLSSDSRLNILLPNTNKALAEAVKLANPEQLEILKEGKDIKSILTSLFQNKVTSSKSDQTLIDILKNAPLFQTMGSMSEQFRSLLVDLKNTPEFTSKVFIFEGFLKHLESMDSSVLKQQLSESGIFMESKIASIIERFPLLDEMNIADKALIQTLLDESMEKDMKSNLMRLREELTASEMPEAAKLMEHTDKLLMQIDYHQLLSHLNSSTSFYLPFEWEMLEQGSMELKKGNEDKFYCQINLQLKEYGNLDLMIGLYNNNQIDIQAHTEKKELNELFNINISLLRSVLIDAGLHPRIIRVLEKKEYHPLQKSYSFSTFEDNFRFEVRG